MRSEQTDSPRAYLDLSAAALSEDWRIEAAAADTILLELDLAFLHRALLSLALANAPVDMRLTKREGRPCLRLDSGDGRLAHDVPVRLLPASEAAFHQPPATPPPAISVALPRCRLTQPNLH